MKSTVFIFLSFGLNKGQQFVLHILCCKFIFRWTIMRLFGATLEGRNSCFSTIVLKQCCFSPLKNKIMWRFWCHGRHLQSISGPIPSNHKCTYKRKCAPTTSCLTRRVLSTFVAFIEENMFLGTMTF